METKNHQEELKTGERFAFGKNWERFLSGVDEERISRAGESLCLMLGVRDLRQKSFLDVGSGSGLFSLAARKLGAKVFSFDYDSRSVACALELKRRYLPNDGKWHIEQGSILDESFLSGLGRFDIVYSWGVLHHTGNMHEAFKKIAALVARKGLLYIAIYNDQGPLSRYWKGVKRAYNKNAASRILITAVHAPYLFGARWLARALTGRLALERGMSLWYDMIDWLGGYPFQTATPREVESFFAGMGFALVNKKTCGRKMGCNEFVFCLD